MITPAADDAALPMFPDGVYARHALITLLLIAYFRYATPVTCHCRYVTIASITCHECRAMLARCHTRRLPRGAKDILLPCFTL